MLPLLQSGMRWLESTYQQKARAWVVRLVPLLPSQYVRRLPRSHSMPVQRLHHLKCHLNTGNLTGNHTLDISCVQTMNQAILGT